MNAAMYATDFFLFIFISPLSAFTKEPQSCMIYDSISLLWRQARRPKNCEDSGGFSVPVIPEPGVRSEPGQCELYQCAARLAHKRAPLKKEAPFPMVSCADPMDGFTLHGAL
jgi:hypothetical protein